MTRIWYKEDGGNLVTCLKKFSPRSLKTEGATGDQHPGIGLPSTEQGIRSAALGRYKNLCDAPAINLIPVSTCGSGICMYVQI